jgi:hypothetical protein
MDEKKNAEKEREAGNQEEGRDATKQQPGGREFGNVIEPMQAQMASDNKGLAAEQEKKSAPQTEAEKNKKPAA